MLTGTYRFFDAGFTLETDSPAFATGFDRAYGRFKAQPDPEQPGPLYRVLLSGSPEVVVEGQTWRSAEAETTAVFATNAILNAATGRVRSHYLFHAAALEAPGGGGGVIVAGRPGAGKTTLALALIEHGYKVYSDDVAAVGRADGRLYPFPRRLGLRVPNGRPGRKLMLDLAEIAPEGLPETASCPARTLFLLTEAKSGPDPQGTSWFLLVDRVTDALIAGVRAAPGVTEAQSLPEAAFPALRIALAPDAWPGAEPALQEACQRNGVLLFEVARGPGSPPDFSGAPVLDRLHASEAARDLIGYLKGGPRSALLRQEFGGSAALLYVALAGLTSGMQCYRLQSGRLPEMVEAIVSHSYRSF
jgi:hypothetical protein